MKLDKQIKLQIKNSKERSTDQELDQQIVSQSDILTDEKLDEQIQCKLNLDATQIEFI